MTESVMRVVRSRGALDEALGGRPIPAVRSARASSAAVFTMGALHDGHRSLIRAARGEVGPTGHVTVSIFVNPTQFAAGEDYDNYPRDLEADLSVCAEEDVDLVFAPTTAGIYPKGEPTVRLDPGPVGAILDGASRPGHFVGVLTVVLKLMQLTRPEATFFGEKDYQQLVLVRRMAADLDLPIKVHGVPTKRDSDGVALSSRNAYLDETSRALAAALPAALAAGSTAADLGRSAEAVVGAAELELIRAKLQPEYVAVTDPELGPAPTIGAARLLLATRVGQTRLIDNTPITLRA